MATLDYSNLFEKIEKLNPIPRGTAFELLINKIFFDQGLSIYKRFRTSNNSQEIDGAILVYNKVFLLEAKWENEDTLAASKLYSFLGKINSKLEGTLGIFISYNELKENFVQAIRSGLRQNCILIHGPANILNIVKGKVNVKEYLEYCYIEASTKNIAHVDTEAFLLHGPVITSNPTVNIWLDIFNELTNASTLAQFTAKLQVWDLTMNEIGVKILNVYNTIIFNDLIKAKFQAIIDALINLDTERFTASVVEKYKSDRWKEYADQFLTGLLIDKINMKESERVEIVDNLSPVLRGNSYDWENLAANVISIFYSQTTMKEKQKLASIFIGIYTDQYRKDKFQQKQLANRIFSDIKDASGKYFDAVKGIIADDIKLLKLEESIYADKEDTDEDKKRITIHRAFEKYIKIFRDNKIDKANAEQILNVEYDN